MNNKGFANVIFIGIVILLLAGAGYWYWQDQNDELETDATPNPTIDSEELTPTPTPIIYGQIDKLPSPDTTGWLESSMSEEYPFSFKYPPEWREVVPQAAVPNYSYILKENNNENILMEIIAGKSGEITKISNFIPQELSVNIPNYKTEHSLLSAELFKVGEYDASIFVIGTDYSKNQVDIPLQVVIRVYMVGFPYGESGNGWLSLSTIFETESFVKFEVNELEQYKNEILSILPTFKLTQ